MGIFNQEPSIVKQINSVREMYLAQQKKAREAAYIERLLLEDYVNTIKKNRSRYDYVDLFKAQAERNNKYKKDRPHFEMVREFLMEDFLNEDPKFKLINIFSCGYEGYGFTFVFKGYGQEFQITVPCLQRIESIHLKYAHYGQFAFTVKESEACWEVLKESYEIKDIADFIKEYFNLEKET